MVLDLRFFYTLVLMVASTISATIAMRRLYRLMMLGRKEMLWGELPERIGRFSKVVLAQSKLFKDFGPGLQHAIIFWGFIIITIGTIEAVLEGLFHGFTFEFLGPVFHGIVFVQDFLHPLVLAAVLYGAWRRLIVNPKRLPSDWAHKRDAVFVLILTGTLMLANILSFGGFVLAGHEFGHAAFRPVSRLVAELFSGAGVAPSSGATIGYLFWGLHVLVVFSFGAYIPHSKHLHILAAGPNVFFFRTKSRGTFSKVNFEDETQTSYGVGKITQFSWKDLLDTYSCTQCGRCNEFCPTATTGKPLRPMKLVEDVKHYLFDHGDAILKDPSGDHPEPLMSEKSGLTEETIWACTTCRACVEACPVMIEHVDKIVDMRRNLVLMEGKMPAELQVTMKNWETQSNPWGMPADSRDEWARSMNIARFADKPNAEYLFYVGCAGSFNDRNKKISTAFAKILQKAGIDFAILGKEELCNGETARRAGNEYLAKTMIDANIEVLKRYNVKKILATCPHCFNTLKNEYPDFGFTADVVMHHTEFLDQLIREGKIKDAGYSATQVKVAFHDSCYLGRYNDVYDAPRNILRSFGSEVIELPRNKQKGLCCGAGGARMWMEETIGKRINVERVEEALTTRPEVIAAACPYCQVMVSDGVTEKAQSDKVKVLDIAEIVADRL